MVTDPGTSSFLRVLRVRHIATSLQDAEIVKSTDEPTAAAKRLRERRFDQAPVLAGKRVVGWVLTEALHNATKVKSVLHELGDSAIVSEDASISDVLRLLAKQGFVFTVGERGLAGFVTPSDLDRHASRTHFYLLLADVEMALADIVRHDVLEARVLARLGGYSLKRWKSASAENAEADAVEYLYIKDLAELFLETQWGATLDQSHRDAMTELCKFRPTVMHPTRRLTAGRNPQMLASLARRG